MSLELERVKQGLKETIDNLNTQREKIEAELARLLSAYRSIEGVAIDREVQAEITPVTNRPEPQGQQVAAEETPLSRSERMKAFHAKRRAEKERKKK